VTTTAVSVAVPMTDNCVVPQVHPESVALVRSNGPRSAEVAAVASMFKLLGDPTRARILYALLEAGELCVCDIAAATDTAESTVSAALRLLRTARVATGRRDGRMVYYRLADDHVRSLLELSRDHANHVNRLGERR
jgi:ArsR family transcriptional regulator, lead/cadmium/zinc/bismuth-responsive transcriptional repressor